MLGSGKSAEPATMTDHAEWTWGYLLHNLDLNGQDPFETEHVAIVSGTDPRARSIVENAPIGRQLLENFKDQQGNKINPSVLLYRADAPEWVKDVDALVGFRNAYAMACVIFGWQQSIGGQNVMYPLHSDYFDFHPATLGKDTDFIVGRSSAQRWFGQPSPFCGQNDPALPTIKDTLLIHPDDVLMPRFMETWRRCFANPVHAIDRDRALFRSLQIAYHASQTADDNKESIYDHGTRLTLWVSAMEILAHPSVDGADGGADFGRVRSLLEQNCWLNDELNGQEYQFCWRKKKYCVNLVVKLSWDIYQARNAFLHGNPVTMTDLFPFQDHKRPSLILLAPLVYKAALIGFLQLNRLNDPSKLEEPDFIDQHLLEDALLCSIKDR
jgi:hypothetical protein